MATMWFSKDGKRPHTQSGPGINISFEEIQAVFGKEHLRYVGTEAPSINPDTPSYFEENVVLEIDENDGVSELLPKVGFYLVVDVRPYDAESKLHAHRGTKQ
jgi:hypothetical protein